MPDIDDDADFNEEDEADQTANWKASAITVHVRKELEKERRRAMDRLLLAANDSTDPKVRSFSGALWATESAIALLGGKPLYEEIAKGQ